MPPTETATGDVSESVRRSWRDANLAPLWESPTAHKPDPGPPRSRHWQWDLIRPLVAEAVKAQSPAAVERRVLLLINQGEDESTTRNIAAALQILQPGERARPHRHSMNALRFVLEGNGAATIVDGKSCPMEEGDLVLTPGWCWHEHVHEGEGTIIWLDVLDVPFHMAMGTAAFEPGPAHSLPATAPDSSFAFANIVPETDGLTARHSPVFRYPWDDAAAAVAAAPRAADGARRVRYVDPTTGGPCMDLMDCYLVGLDAGAPTLPVRSNANSVCAVVRGNGTSRIGDDTIAWRRNDIFTVPQGNWASHTGDSGDATLLVVTDREIYRRLDLLVEETGNDR